MSKKSGGGVKRASNTPPVEEAEGAEVPSVYREVLGFHMDKRKFNATFDNAIAKLGGDAGIPTGEDKDRIQNLMACRKALKDPCAGGERTPLNWILQRSGRASTAQPSVHNITKKFGVRSLFIPAPGKVFVRGDWKSSHGVIAAGLSGSKAAVKAIETGDFYDQGATLLVPELVDGDPVLARRVTKIGFLSWLNGQGAEALATLLRENGVRNVSRSDAKARMERMNARFPELSSWVATTQTQRSWTTRAGRAVELPESESSHKAVGWMLQGFEADALVRVLEDLRGQWPVAFVCYDEVVLEVVEADAENAASELMVLMNRAIRWAADIPYGSPERVCAVDIRTSWGDPRRSTDADDDAIPEDGPHRATFAELQLTAKGFVAKTSRNLLTILRMDPRWAGRIRRNTFDYHDEFDGRWLGDTDYTRLKLWADEHYGVEFSTPVVMESMTLVAEENAYSPVEQFLRGAVWDGVPRIDNWLQRYMGVEDENPALVGLYGRRFLMSCVARALDPGCKVDTVLILHGGQGAKKSSFLRLLSSPAWFSDTDIDIGDKDSYQSIQGVWIYELPELDSVKKKDVSATKAFLSSQVDKFRPSYGRQQVKIGRQTVFVASTNEDGFLNDPTGSRRFWVVTVGFLDHRALADDREQLWAEAAHHYLTERGCADCAAQRQRTGPSGRCTAHRWWFEADEDVARAQANRRFEVVDDWYPVVKAWCDAAGAGEAGRAGYFTFEILEKALGIEKKEVNLAQSKRLAPLMRMCGWRARTLRKDDDRAQGWTPPGA